MVLWLSVFFCVVWDCGFGWNIECKYYIWMVDFVERIFLILDRYFFLFVCWIYDMVYLNCLLMGVMEVVD